MKFFSFSPSGFIKSGWPKLQNIYGGKKIFSKIISYVIPYTGSILPSVQQIENGMAIVTLKDRRAIRNHLDSIHAIALANLGEFTTGLSLISQLNEKAKAILVKIEVIYFKKARNQLTAEASSKIPQHILEDTEFEVVANIKNLDNETVCKVMATWRVRP